MKVYIVLLADEDRTRIQGVFSERKLAEDYRINNPSGDWKEYEDIEEWEIDFKVLEKGTKQPYYIAIHKTGPPKISVGDIEDAATELSEPSIEIDYNRQLEMSWAILAETRAEAERVATETRDQWVRRGWWKYEE